jgi:FtsZ-interacting cell division protein YlmF
VEIAELLLDYAQVFVWPVTVLLLALFFRHAIRDAVSRLRQVDGLGVSATFTQATKQALQLTRPQRHTATSFSSRLSSSHRSHASHVTVEPPGFQEARSIGESFRNGNLVHMDLTKLDDNDAKRLVDFSAGLIFGRSGSIERLSSKTFLLVPPETDQQPPNQRTEH